MCTNPWTCWGRILSMSSLIFFEICHVSLCFYTMNSLISRNVNAMFSNIWEGPTIHPLLQFNKGRRVGPPQIMCVSCVSVYFVCCQVLIFLKRVMSTFSIFTMKTLISRNVNAMFFQYLGRSNHPPFITVQ
jgi:hypothetical protein